MFRVLVSLQLLVLVLAQWDVNSTATKQLNVGIPPDVSRHRNLGLLPASCGVAPLSSRITSGQPAGIFEFPWMAQIYVQGAKGISFDCGGSIINQKYILTAAHCLEGRLHSVRVGEYNMNTAQDCQYTAMGQTVCAPPPQTLRIEKVLLHQAYNQRALENDIGLLRVSPINLTQANSKPVCLPLAEARTYDLANKQGTVAGWGFTEHGVGSPVLLKVTLPVIPVDICQRHQALRLNHGQICAGGVDGRDSCGGDSGGPLLVQSTINGQSTLVQQGIVSFGPRPCGQPRKPGVYTRVAMYMDWILNQLEP